jgi:hypothetical protein
MIFKVALLIKKEELITNCANRTNFTNEEMSIGL